MSVEVDRPGCAGFLAFFPPAFDLAAAFGAFLTLALADDVRLPADAADFALAFAVVFAFGLVLALLFD
ncbi:MAG TPA: hypothetical protein VFV34_20810 [Blastocatellia bacterium]|nr:hypothetical protein [Blastocatellia bacterium]